jgi:restriction system protein
MEIFKYRFEDLINPTLQAFHNLGGSASVAENEDEVLKILNLTNEEANDIHRGNITKLSYRLAWARNYLKRYGVLENSSRGVWVLTSVGLKSAKVDVKEVIKKVKRLDQQRVAHEIKSSDKESSDEILQLQWQERLLQILKTMPPTNFERLCQRVLRELGFVDVKVKGKSGDGGIDGQGIFKFGRVLSFRVGFQCKRYSGSVSSPVVRDFRGSIEGRADKGLLITTGNFTRDAKEEARRDGATYIDLVDGFQFVEILKDLRLGVGVAFSQIEEVEVNKKWYDIF